MEESKSVKGSYQPDHDPYFKVGMSYKQVAVPFLESRLSKDILAKIDLQKLQLESENLVAQALKRKIVDVLFSVPYKDDEQAYIYVLVEQQHKPYRFMPFRLILYVLLVIERILNKQEAEWKKAKAAGEKVGAVRYLPTVIPVVYYTGEDDYKQPRKLLDLFEESETMKALFIEEMPIVEAAKVNKDELTDPWNRVFQGLFAHFNDPNIGEILLQLKHDFATIEQVPNGDAFLEQSIHYLLKSSRYLAEEDVKALSREMDKLGVGGSFMTIMERWESEKEAIIQHYEEEKAEWLKDKAELLREQREREAELLREEKEDTARGLLELGLDYNAIARVTSFTVAKIKEIQRDMKGSANK